MTRRRWIADEWNEETAAITGAQAEHLARVLRAQPGMQADVVAGDRVFRAEIESAALAEVRFRLHEEIAAESALPVTLVLAIYKFDRLEWAIEKATELGAAAIAPVVSRRTEKHLAQSAAKRVERWRRIAQEAAQQSRRSQPLEIFDPAPLASRLRADSAATKIVLAEQERNVMLRDLLEEAANAAAPQLELAIGPEGGWTSDEEELFRANNWRPASLGLRILRAETAAIAALAVAASCLE
jgi:16S rRNA (uracil1498-N3)-methyltransferase